MNAFNIIEQSYTTKIAETIISCYKEVEENFILGKWKPSELDAGHFVEAVRRLIEFEMTGKNTPFNEQLSNFNDKALKDYEQAIAMHESFRILIPRVLISIYKIRNKRGVGHTGEVSPNEMDSTYILNSVKWVLAEIIRLKSNLSINETQKIVDEIVERRIEMIWKDGDDRKILNPNMKAGDQILVLLYDKSPQSGPELFNSNTTKHSTRFNNYLLELEDKVYIKKNKDDTYSISPTGKIKAEDIILLYKRYTT